MLAVPSFKKRPTKVPKLKSARLFYLSHKHVKGFLSKCTVFKVDLLQDHEIYCLEACMFALFSPEILQARGSEGVNTIV